MKTKTRKAKEGREECKVTAILNTFLCHFSIFPFFPNFFFKIFSEFFSKIFAAAAAAAGATARLRQGSAAAVAAAKIFEKKMRGRMAKISDIRRKSQISVKISDFGEYLGF